MTTTTTHSARHPLHHSADTTEDLKQEERGSVKTHWPATPEHSVGGDQLDLTSLTSSAGSIYDLTRSMSHATGDRPVIPAPVLHHILGEIVAAPLGQLLRHLSRGLAASPDHYAFTEQAPYRSPSTSIVFAVGHLADAARAAGELTRHLAAAQLAIAGQSYDLGYYPDPDHDLDRAKGDRS
ncbi:MAG: hypothetical protein ACRCYU_09325 [Nocardioides sp.]